jgi:outer membrane protein assembly factor BamB
MHPMRLMKLLPVALLLTPCLTRLQLRAADNDWPGWMGADRTGVSQEKDLLKEWPKGGPKLLWKATDIGNGYSTPSVSAGKIYLMSNRGLDNEFAIALSVKDGKPIWTTPVGKVGEPNQVPPYPGSRSTPTVDGDAVYVLGSDGDLACLDADNGQVRWKKNLRKEFNGKPGVWAYSESPLIDGETLVCTPGGDKASLVALNKKNGELMWQSAVDLGQVTGRGRPTPGNTAAYASPIVVTVGGVKQYIQFMHGGTVGVSSKDGKLLWKYQGVVGITNCTTALFHEDSVFVSAAGFDRAKSGCALLKLAAEGDGISAKEVYHNLDLANHHGGVVRIGDYVYGTNNTELVCVDFKSGQTKWKDRSVGKGSITAADDRLYVRGEKGPVALVEAKPDGYKEVGRFEQPDRSKKNAWPHPVIAGGRLYLRDQDVLLCYDVKAK